MNWSDVPHDTRAIVLEILRLEAARNEEKATQGQAAASALGRPSLLEEPLRLAAAFQAAIELLEKG